MKRFSLVQVALLAVLMVVAVSCTTYRDAGEYYEDEPRYMYQRTPYVGSGSVIIVERDPFTGRYYQVSPYGYYSGSPYSYDSRYDSRYYNNNRYYNNRGYTNRTNQQPVTEQQRQQTRENMEAAKERVLGQKKSN